MSVSKALAIALSVISATVIAGPSRSNEATDQIETNFIIASCGMSDQGKAAPIDAGQKAKLIACLEKKAEDGHLPFGLILGIADLLQSEGRNAEALEYLAYFYVVMNIDEAGCSALAGSGWADSVVLFTKATTDPTVTSQMRRDAVRRALALEAATAAKRPRDTKGCFGTAKSAGESSDNHGVPEPVWRQRRAEVLRKIEPVLLAVVSNPQAPKH